MTSNQIAYNVHLENQKHNRTTETETNRHNLVTEGISRDELSETKRHNIFGEQVSYGNLLENQRHNRRSEDLQKYDTKVKRQNAVTAYKGTKYAADANYAGTRYSADQHFRSTKYSADQSAAASRYASDRNFQAAKYGADSSRKASQYASDKNYSSSIYGSDSRYRGQIGSTTISSNTQRQINAANNYNQRRLQDSRNRASYITTGISTGGRLISSAFNLVNAKKGKK